jgi:G3E family GTPase
MLKQLIPVMILSGFLGSGKTTFLLEIINYYKQQNKRVAVVMNELGEVNLEGMLIDTDVPLSELTSGCICCTISAELGVTIKDLIDVYHPDVILIESTGVAYPFEVLDAISEAALYTPIQVEALMTVIDAPHLMKQSRMTKGKTYKLMQEQIKSANVLLLNKSDHITYLEQAALVSFIKGINPQAPLFATVKGKCDLEKVLKTRPNQHEVGKKDSEFEQGYNEQIHHSHRHVSMVTHYISHPVERTAFKKMIASLPDNVYRGKGLIRFNDDENQHLFHYAYQTLEIVSIRPKMKIEDVMVFIGENIDRLMLEAKLTALLEKRGRNYH